jgi:ABC-2 type transport system permease protein
MSVVVEETPPRTRPGRDGTGLSTVGVVRSEWAKLWSLRSTWITLGLGLLFLMALGMLAALQYTMMTGPEARAADPDLAGATTLGLALFGVSFAMIALGVLGVLTASGEYTTGLIRSTLAAVPARLPVLWAKAAVYGLLATVTGTVGAFASFLIASRILSDTAIAMSLSDTGVVRSLLGAGVYLGLAGVAGVALGALLRSTAGGISALVGTFMLVPGLMSLLPESWRDDLTRYLPSNAGASIFALQPDPGMLSAGAGLLVLLGWTALALGGAAFRLMRSDA